MGNLALSLSLMGKYAKLSLKETKSTNIYMKSIIAQLAFSNISNKNATKCPFSFDVIIELLKKKDIKKSTRANSSQT